MKRDKGEFGYIKSQKIKRGLITLVMFAIPIIIFLTGLFITKTRLNMFTFVAIMGCSQSSNRVYHDADAKTGIGSIKRKDRAGKRKCTDLI